MPEYLAPGVYVEEVSFRSKSIEGVPTSTTGFAGMTAYGPVRYEGGPATTEPRLVTSFAEFERIYGGLQDLLLGADPTTTGTDERDGYLAHAARAFFNNGGKRLYVSRVFVERPGAGGVVAADRRFGVASLAVPSVAGPAAAWRARWPGRVGNVHLECKIVRSKNVAFKNAAGELQATRAKKGSVVEIFDTAVAATAALTAAAAAARAANRGERLTLDKLHVVEVDGNGKQTFIKSDGTVAVLAATSVIHLIELRVVVTVDAERVDVYDELGTHRDQKRYLGKILQLADPEDENSVVWLQVDETPFASAAAAGAAASVDKHYAAALMHGLVEVGGARLAGGHDGQEVTAVDLEGKGPDPDAKPDDPLSRGTGLAALGEIDDVAIVALPDSGGLSDKTQCEAATQALIAHAETNRYRIAVIDAPIGSSMTEVREFRGKFDSKYGALYHPWIEILDPLERPAQGAPPRRLLLPPSGFVTGIYARSDIERGVHKAPANEVVRGLTKFEANINKGRQDVLNPEGINALRFFEGRGSRVWGARTISSDPEWKYVNVRRLFIFIEHSIDKGTQWAVFEPNNERLWANVRRTVEDFLLVLWKDGALLGSKPEEAFFVRCDRTTMTQNDLDNGRLICLIGVCPTKPAEFVIFRIGQWTADAKKN